MTCDRDAESLAPAQLDRSPCLSGLGGAPFNLPREATVAFPISESPLSTRVSTLPGTRFGQNQAPETVIGTAGNRRIASASAA